jgi:hypothetical protein
MGGRASKGKDSKKKISIRRIENYRADQLKDISSKEKEESYKDAQNFWHDLYRAGVGILEINPSDFWPLTLKEWLILKDIKCSQGKSLPSRSEIQNINEFLNKAQKPNRALQ